MQKKYENLSSSWQLMSMTGVGRASSHHEGISIEVTTRSVNHRGIDVKYRFVDDLNETEFNLVPLVRDYVHRGHVEITIAMDVNEEKSKVSIDEDKAVALIKDVIKLNDRYPEVLPMSMGELLAFPGMVSPKEEKFSKQNIGPVINDLVKASLLDLVASRRHEGKILTIAIEKMFKEMHGLITSIAASEKKDVLKRFDRFKARVEELFATFAISEDRLYQECALLAERSDFKEEIDRLNAHLEHFHTISSSPDAKGRKLDFICQEMFRESNTLIAKAFDSDVIRKAIELKAEIERIREQVQNIE